MFAHLLISPPRRLTASRSAFTLIELLTVIAILGILAAILIPVTRSVAKKAKIAQSTSNVRQIGGLTAIYVLENRGKLPTDYFPADDAWIRVLWRMQYGDRVLSFNPDSQGRILADTIFYTPLQESSSASVTTPRSYGWNGELRILLSTQRVAGILVAPDYVRVVNPSRTMVLADSTSGSTLLSTNNQINFRNDGSAICLFADWHVEKRSRSSVPASRQESFWGGNQ